MDDVLQFELALRHEAKKRGTENDSDDNNNRYKLDYIEFNYEGFPTSLKDFLNEIVTSAGVPEFILNDDTEIMVTDMSFFQRLSSLISRTPKTTITNYIGWRVVEVRGSFVIFISIFL